MTCIEYIILRAPDCDSARAIQELTSALSSLSKPDALNACWILRRKTVLGDVAALLIWSEEQDSIGSWFGQQIKSVMSTFGMVSHSIWVE